VNDSPSLSKIRGAKLALSLVYHQLLLLISDRASSRQQTDYLAKAFLLSFPLVWPNRSVCPLVGLRQLFEVAAWRRFRTFNLMSSIVVPAT
jgi:hypothetical protein